MGTVGGEDSQEQKKTDGSFLLPSVAILQQVFQYFLCVNFVNIPFAPIVLFWNLCVENRIECADQFALFLSDFSLFVVITLALRVIENIKSDSVSFALCFC